MPRNESVQATEIEILAKRMLDEKELKLAFHLAMLMKKSPAKARTLMREILPIYHRNLDTLEPRAIYRHLYYMDDYSRGAYIRRFTRFFIHMTCGHLEACLHVLAKLRRPFGPLVYKLQADGIITQQLKDQLLDFNNTVYIPAKHFIARENLPRKINKRTFAVEDGTLAFMMARKLSMELFSIIKSRGTPLPEDWKPFNEEWLSWDRDGNSAPFTIN